VHTQWQDEGVLYSDLHPTTGHNNPATVAAYQEMARQKLVGCKDAPAFMLQMFCDLTKPPQPGDIFGRCNKAHAKETGKCACTRGMELVVVGYTLLLTCSLPVQ